MGFLGNMLGVNTKPKTKEDCRKELGELESGKKLLWAKHGFDSEEAVKRRIKYLKGIMKTY